MTMNRRTLLATGASAATLAALGLPVRAQDAPLKVGFIYVGPDRRRRLDLPARPGPPRRRRRSSGDRVETIYQESVP
jgi:hypothetical protein